ncbi:hypothetical protein BDC45DRAFT_129030 [Circinella umbellata]|nr:hypothetical protein BDC45DRAFT_129030 [Circinella umbellata]
MIQCCYMLSIESSRNTFRHNKDTVLIEQEGCEDQVYFCCPYKNCDSKCVKKLSLLGHLRKKHSVDLPQFNQIGSSSYNFKTCSGKVLDFSKDHGVLNRNEKILYELKSLDDQMQYKDQHRLYYCPYQACSRLVTFRKPSPFYSHIRSHHDKDFPLMTNRRSRSYVFKTTSGIIVDFRDNKQKLLRKNDKIRFEEKSPKGKFYCPYKGCKTSYFRRVIVINHIRDSHHLMSPPGITSHKIVFKTVSGQNVDLSVSQNLLQPEETLFVENPKGEFRCPYEGCSRSGNCRSFILDHIRHRHYSNLPLLKHSNIMVPLKSSSGEIIDFSENSQTVLKEGDKIITPEEDDDVDKGQYFYCPYQGCNTRKGFRNSFVSHIRERHYRGIKKLFKLRDGQCYVFKTSTGQVIDFNNEDSHNLLKNGDKILVEKEYL